MAGLNLQVTWSNLSCVIGCRREAGVLLGLGEDQPGGEEEGRGPGETPGEASGRRGDAEDRPDLNPKVTFYFWRLFQNMNKGCYLHEYMWLWRTIAMEIQHSLPQEYDGMKPWTVL